MSGIAAARGKMPLTGGISGENTPERFGHGGGEQSSWSLWLDPGWEAGPCVLEGIFGGCRWIVSKNAVFWYGEYVRGVWKAETVMGVRSYGNSHHHRRRVCRR